MFHGFIGFIIGIALASFFHVGKIFLLSVAFLAAVIFVVSKIVSSEKRAWLMIVFFSLVGILLGSSRIYFSDLYHNSNLKNFSSQKIYAEGIIVDEPDVRETSQKLTVRIDRVFINGATTSPKEKILITAGLFPEYRYGDMISISTALKKPDKIESEDGRVFDYKNYLLVRGIWYTASFAKVNLISSDHGSLVKTGLFKLKKFFTESLERAIPFPESALMSGLLLGSKQSLGKNLLDQFSRTGVSHVVVLSGYNITIVAESIMAILGFLGAAASFWIGCAVIILFTLLSGGGASAWRAALLVLIALFTKHTGRIFSVEKAFALVVAIMLLWNPLLLVFDPSFQLSVLATIGIIFVSPVIEIYLWRIPEKFGLKEIISATISTQLVVLPFLIYSTGTLSLVALPVNILVLGTVPITMLLGFVTGVLGMFSFWLSVIPGILSYVLLWYQLSVVHIGATLPGGAFDLPAFSFWPGGTLKRPR
jgi:competence protein ComEC